ncbi:MAG: hypothetical protein ACLTXI_00060 [Collinsella sp.]
MVINAERFVREHNVVVTLLACPTIFDRRRLDGSRIQFVCNGNPYDNSGFIIKRENGLLLLSVSLGSSPALEAIGGFRNGSTRIGKRMILPSGNRTLLDPIAVTGIFLIFFGRQRNLVIALVVNRIETNVVVCPINRLNCIYMD